MKEVTIKRALKQDPGDNSPKFTDFTGTTGVFTKGMLNRMFMGRSLWQLGTAILR